MLPQRTLDYFGGIIDFGGYLAFTPFKWNNYGRQGKNRIELNGAKYWFQFFALIQLWIMTFYEIYLILDLYHQFHGILTFRIIRILYSLILCRYFNTKYRMIIFDDNNYRSFVNGFLEISNRFGCTGNNEEIEIGQGDKMATFYIKMCVFFFTFSTVKSCLRIFTKPHLYSIFPFDMSEHPIKTIFLTLIQVNISCYQNYLMALSHITLAAYIFSIRPIMKRLRNSTRPFIQFEYQVNDNMDKHDFEDFSDIDIDMSMETEFGYAQPSELLHVVVLDNEINEIERETDYSDSTVEELSVDKKSDDYCYKLFQQLRIIETQFKETFSHKTMTFEIFELFIILLNFMPLFWLIQWNILLFMGISLYFVVILNAFACIHGVSTKTMSMSTWTGSGGLNGNWNWLLKFRKSAGQRSFRGNKNQFYFSSRRLNFTVLSIVVFGSMSELL